MSLSILRGGGVMELLLDKSWLIPGLVVYVLGYVFSVCIGDFLCQMILEHGYTDTPKENNIYPRIVGWIERFLYTTAFLIGQTNFVAIWFGLKVASRWEAAKLEKNEKSETKKYREYQEFLIGNGLSLLYAATGWKIIKWGLQIKEESGYENLLRAGYIPLGMVFLSLSLKIFWEYVRTREEVIRKKAYEIYEEREGKKERPQPTPQEKDWYEAEKKTKNRHVWSYLLINEWKEFWEKTSIRRLLRHFRSPQ